MSNEKNSELPPTANKMVKAIPEPDTTNDIDEISDLELEQVAGGGSGQLNTMTCLC